MGTFWKCVLVKFVLNEFVLTKDLVYIPVRLVIQRKKIFFFTENLEKYRNKVQFTKKHSTLLGWAENNYLFSFWKKVELE